MLHRWLIGAGEWGNSATKHWFIYSFIITPFFVTVLLTYINIKFDTSEPVYRKAEVLEKKITKRMKRGRTIVNYRIRIKPWNAKIKKEELHIRQDQYNRLNTGSYAYFKTKNGFLNREYIFGPPDNIIEIR